MTDLLRTPGLALVAGALLSACTGSGGDDVRDPSAPEPRASKPSSGQDRGERSSEAACSSAIRITFGDTELTGQLLDNATARDLAAQLPLTLSFRDHNSAEKTAALPRQVSNRGTPAGHDPAAGDIGYWAPDGDLVFYYDDAAPYFEGIVRIGELEGDVAALERQPDGIGIRIERAGSAN